MYLRQRSDASRRPLLADLYGRRREAANASERGVVETAGDGRRRARAVQGRRRLGRRRVPDEAHRLGQRQEVPAGVEHARWAGRDVRLRLVSTSSRYMQPTAGQSSSRTRAGRRATARSSIAESRWSGAAKTYADIMNGVEAVLAKNPWIDADRLGVTGGSYGGYMTNWIISHTTRFKAAVTLRSISNFVSDDGTRDGGVRSFGRFRRRHLRQPTTRTGTTRR